MRFCVLARVTSPVARELPPVLRDLVDAAKADGFHVELVSQLGTTPPINLGKPPVAPKKVSFTAAQPPREACEVYDGTVKGWYPGSVPAYAREGTSHGGLVVRWD